MPAARRSKVARFTLYGAGALVAVVLMGGLADVLLMQYPGPTVQQALHRMSLMRDSSVPTWFASILLLACSASLALNAVFERGSHRWPWSLLAVVFAILSIDEIAMLHELSGILLRRVAPAARSLDGVFTYSWVIVGLSAVGVLAVVLWRWFSALALRDRLLFGASAALFVGGACGMEMFNAAVEDAAGGVVTLYAVTTAVEEALEFAGALLFLYALIDRLKRLGVAVRIIQSPQADDVGALSGGVLARTKLR